MKKDKVDEPEWLESSKCRSLIKVSSDALDPAIRKFFDAIGQNFDQILPKSEDLLNNRINEIVNDQQIEGSDSYDQDAPPLSDEELEKSLDTGYSKKNIEKLNQLMDVINK